MKPRILDVDPKEHMDREFSISPNLKRFDQKNDIFNRSMWDESVDAKKFFQSYDLANLNPKNSKGFSHWDYAFRNASWHITDFIGERNFDQDGTSEGFTHYYTALTPSSPTKVELTSEVETTRRVKLAAKMFGAGMTGVCKLDERWVYSKNFSRTTQSSHALDLPKEMKYAIMLILPMDFDLSKTSPSALSGATTGLGYTTSLACSNSLAQFIVNLGYQAIASLNDTALNIPMAIEAGLGEYGRHGLLITPKFGPNVRIAKVFTDLPLVPDKPIAFGVKEFCSICKRCANSCPAKAIPHEEPQSEPPNFSSHTGIRKWTINAEKCFKFWVGMNTDCAICIRVCPYNKDFRKWWHRWGIRLANSPLRRIMMAMDDVCKYATRIEPLKWWRANVLIALLITSCANQPASMPTVVKMNRELLIEEVPASLGIKFINHFNRYTKVVAHNGKPIHIVIQDEITEEQIVRCRNILTHFLTDYPGSTHGHDRSAIANKMANSNATLALLDGQDDGKNTINVPAQYLFKNEIQVEGHAWYIQQNYEHRDASYEEILHLLHDFGIGVDGHNTMPGAAPEFQKSIRRAQVHAQEHKLWGANDRAADWIAELADENSLSQEYLAALIDTYYGLWGAWDGDGGMYGLYSAKVRDQIQAEDPHGQALVDKVFFHPYLTYDARIDPSFRGTFLLRYDAALPYTHHSQYLKDITLLGSANNNVRVNELDNHITGSAGINIIYFAGPFQEYAIDTSGHTVVVTDLVADRDGKNELVDVEKLTFTDRDMDVATHQMEADLIGGFLAIRPYNIDVVDLPTGHRLAGETVSTSMKAPSWQTLEEFKNTAEP